MAKRSLKDVPECFRIPFRFQGDSRDVQRHDPKIHPTGIDFISVFVFPALQEGTATHRCLETARQFNDFLSVHQHILGYIRFVSNKVMANCLMS